MTLREFLHTEIWSKKTSRRIFIAFGVVAIAFVGFYQVDTRWTSPGERRAAREALLQLDTLKAFTSNSNDGYEAAHELAKQRVDVALHSTLTSRDLGIASTLSMYLMSIEIVIEDRTASHKMEVKFANSADERMRKMEVERQQSSNDLQHSNDFLGRSLHSLLD